MSSCFQRRIAESNGAHNDDNRGGFDEGGCGDDVGGHDGRGGDGEWRGRNDGDGGAGADDDCGCDGGGGAAGGAGVGDGGAFGQCNDVMVVALPGVMVMGRVLLNWAGVCCIDVSSVPESSGLGSRWGSVCMVVFLALVVCAWLCVVGIVGVVVWVGLRLSLVLVWLLAVSFL